MASTSSKQTITASQDEATDGTIKSNPDSTAIWFCPSRWLLAHHDPHANIFTMPGYLCLADLNNDGENLLALVDFKSLQQPNFECPAASAPYQCRLRVYRGQHLIYNHFLEDVPCCLIVSSTRGPATVGYSGGKMLKKSHPSLKTVDRLLLTLPINDDVYFYHKLKPQHRISLEDDDRILASMNKSELDAWQMVKQNQVDVDTMRELLASLGDALGSHELSSHSSNFLALQSKDERKNYLLLWKFKKLGNGAGEHIMSMDTICCAAARLRYESNVTGTGGDLMTGTSRWNKLLDVQRDGLVLGTEDRHLLIYELGFSRSHLESSYRLPSAADHILIERRSPQSFDLKCDLKDLTYRIIISCRNCRIYTLDQNYLPDCRRASGAPSAQELIALSCNVVDMCWTAENDLKSSESRDPSFIVACLDRRVYCFSSKSGQNKWIAELELPITCLVSMPIPRINADETCLVGVASETNRIDLFVSSSGRIVDSIYLSDDYCQAMTFGRFGREDNCLCLTTNKGRLVILILKRTAKFANAQCLSSAASYASHVVSSCSHLLQGSPNATSDPRQPETAAAASRRLSQMKEPPELPKPFAITKSTIVNPTDHALDQLQLNHNCDQVVAKDALDSNLVKPKLQIPVKNRDFVDQIVHQARCSGTTSKAFARDLLKLRDKVRLANRHPGETNLNSTYEDANRVIISKITGLGNIYRVSLSLWLSTKHHLVPSGMQSSDDLTDSTGSEQLVTRVILFVASKQHRCRLYPFRFELIHRSNPAIKSSTDLKEDDKSTILERAIDFKLVVLGQEDASSVGQESDSITLDVHVMPPRTRESLLVSGGGGEQTNFSCRPLLVSSINIPIA